MRDIFQNPEHKSLSPENYGVFVRRHEEVMAGVNDVLIHGDVLELEGGDQNGKPV